MAGTQQLTPADEDALLSDLAEADRHVRQTPRGEMDRAYVAALLRHALEIVEGKPRGLIYMTPSTEKDR